MAEGRGKSYDFYSTVIKALRTANSLPADFTPTTNNTVSVSGSEKPVYIFFDNTNNAGIMYFYTEAKDIYMNADSSYAFHSNKLS